MTEKRGPRKWIRQWWFPLLEFDHVYIAYLPNKDKDGARFDVRRWETKALRLQGKLFGVATSWPSRGSYRVIDSERKIRRGVILEETRMVTSFITEDDNQTGQQTVAFAVDDRMHYIPL